ncbi:MAG: AMP-binding protein, partial [Myxococcota bacterium]|nr:AMP-binding protein [Myxococcota bacterium]
MQADAPSPDPAAAPWEESTIPRVALAAAARYGDAPALVDEEGGATLSFRELLARGLEVARALLARGLAPGDRVGLWAPNLPAWVPAALGLQMAGGVLVPLNTRFKAPEAGFILRRSRARWLFTVGDFLGQNYADVLRDEELPHLEGIVRLRGEAKAGVPFEAFLAEGEAVA